MHEVVPEALDGFRRPTAAEHQGILAHMDRQYRRELRPMGVWQAFCSVLAGALLISLIYHFTSQSVSYSIVSALLFAAAAACVWAIGNGKRRKRSQMDRLRQGDYLVLDCRAFACLFSTKLNSQAEVKIYNQQQQYCSQKFLIGRETALECQRNGNTPLLLMKCCGCYVLFSAAELRGH